MTCDRPDAPGFTCGGSRRRRRKDGTLGAWVYRPCGQHFGSLESFDWHFRKGPSRTTGDGERHCATPSELRKHGLHQDANGVWKRPIDEQAEGRFRSRDRTAVAAITDALQG